MFLHYDIVYDLEVYPNFFSCAAEAAWSDHRWYFEVSDWRNDSDKLLKWLRNATECRMVGFNNLFFDYPILHQGLRANQFTAESCYYKCDRIINGGRFENVVWENDHIIPQLDLYKIHHFDTPAKATSLKILEYNLRKHLQELPFPPGTRLTEDQAQIIRDYNFNDIEVTKEFYLKSQSEIKLRDSLTHTMQKDYTNKSDVKMGEIILVDQMEKRGLSCHNWDGRKKVKKQTKHNSINLGDVIFKYVKFERPEFERVRSYLVNKTIKETKGVFQDLIAIVEGIEYKIGQGGLHGSVSATTVHSCDKYQILDFDVASFYANLAIKNNLYPAHLGKQFCDAYLSIYETRKSFPKGSAENNAYKLALNGAYGGSNNEHSPFYDSKYTMTITINGQLLLLMLIEQMIKIKDLKMIQANTDGITFLCPRDSIDEARNVCAKWEKLTELELEEAQYKSMHIRDVNNYLVDVDGKKVKRIGAYAYETALENSGTRELPWYKDWSARVIQMAAEAHLIRGENIDEYLRRHKDKYDFLLRTKVPRASKLHCGDVEVGNVVRYYISKTGKELYKYSPPTGSPGEYKRASKVSDYSYDTIMAEIGPGVHDERIHTKNKSVHDERKISINAGWLVTICNDLSLYNHADIDYSYYSQAANKLVQLGGSL